MFSVIVVYWNRFVSCKFANPQSTKLGFRGPICFGRHLDIRVCSVLKGNVLMVVLSNYMVDIDWLLSGGCLLKKLAF